VHPWGDRPQGSESLAGQLEALKSAGATTIYREKVSGVPGLPRGSFEARARGTTVPVIPVPPTLGAHPRRGPCMASPRVNPKHPPADDG